MKEKFAVSGMTCAACSAGIEKAVRRLDGVQKADVSLMGECMDVEYDEKNVSRETIIRTVVELGYGAEKYDENILRERKSQPDVLKKRFLLSLAFLIPLMYFSMGGMVGLSQPSEIVSVTSKGACKTGSEHGYIGSDGGRGFVFIQFCAHDPAVCRA